MGFRLRLDDLRIGRSLLDQFEQARMLAEWGIGEFPKVGDKAQWFTETFQIMKARFSVP
jgi:hypothetical protein